MNSAPKLHSPEEPPPPTDDGSDGGDDREEHKLALLYCLSIFIWARLLALRGLTEPPRGYIAELLEELEDEGLVYITSDPQPRLPRLRVFVNRIKQAIFRRQEPMGQQLRISLTEAGWAHPPLVKLLEEKKRERQESTPSRYQKVVFMAVGVLVAVLIVSHITLSVVDVLY